MPGTNNDINVLDRSPLFRTLRAGGSDQVNYVINGTEYQLGYYLVDGIYPQHATFVKSIANPQGNKRKLFAKKQEARRKDVERAFGVLQARFAIIDMPCRMMSPEKMKVVITACVIIHNMIVEDERDLYMFNNKYLFQEPTYVPPIIIPGDGIFFNSAEIRDMTRDITSVTRHEALQCDLIEHIWERYGHEEL
jgi:Plant transposon protein